MGILQPALGGTWVVTPEMLRGDQPILFVGPSYERSSDPMRLYAARSATGPERGVADDDRERRVR